MHITDTKKPQVQFWGFPFLTHYKKAYETLKNSQMEFFIKVFQNLSSAQFDMRPKSAKSYIVKWCTFGRNFLRGILFFCTSSRLVYKYLKKKLHGKIFTVKKHDAKCNVA